MQKKFILILLVFTILLVSVGGCSSVENEPAVQDSQVTVVTDGIGREVELNGPVQKIATSYGIGTHMVFALGAQDRLVGMDSPSQNNKFFNALLPETGTMTSAGSPRDVNIEQLLSLEPDLVIVPGRNRELVDNLEQHGITVFGVIAEDLNQLKDSMLNLGKALGCEDKAQLFADYYDETVSMIDEKTSDLTDAEKPVVYFVGPMGVLSTCSSDMYQNHLINLCGGKNAAAELKGGWVEVSTEEVLAWNPDIIVVVQYGSTTPEDVLADERLAVVKAVQDGNVMWFPSDFNPWDYPSPQAVLGMEWLATVINPDLFADIDMQDEADKFFNEFYGKTFTELGGKF